MAVHDLNGIKVLVTRPELQAQGLCQAIEAHGGTPLLFPVIEISDPNDNDSLLQVINDLERIDIMIFISANAVEKGLAAIRHYGHMPADIVIAAVGKRTAETLVEHGVEKILVPVKSFDSEGLLRLPELKKVKGKRIAIFRGEGGRETLGDTLKQRGAKVEYAECYRRTQPKVDLTLLKQQPQIAVVTSNEGLENLLALAGEEYREWLTQLPMVVMSERNAEHGRSLGLKGRLLVTEQASDNGLLATLIDWAKQQKSSNAETKLMAESKPETPKKDEKKPVDAKPTVESKAKIETSKPQKPKPAAKARSMVMPFTMTFVMILALAAAGYMAWQQQQKHQQMMTATWQAEHAKLVDEIESLKRQQQVDKREQSLSNKQISKVVEDNQALWTALRQLQSRTTSDPRPWQFAEAEYLLKIANHRLTLQRDVTTAALALKSADGVLRVIADPALQPVREQLAKEQLALTSFEMPDLGGISARLITLSEQISDLPLRGAYLNLKQLESSEVEAVTEEGWRGVLQGVWNELKTLVVISHNDKPVEALLPPQQAVNLQHNIQLQLENARMAALKGESAVWQNSLSHARSWLFDYFDVELPSVKSAIALLDELKKVDVAPTMPDISSSLRMLKKQREALKYPQPGSVPQPAKPASVERKQ